VKSARFIPIARLQSSKVAGIMRVAGMQASVAFREALFGRLVSSYQHEKHVRVVMYEKNEVSRRSIRMRVIRKLLLKFCYSRNCDPFLSISAVDFQLL